MAIIYFLHIIIYIYLKISHPKNKLQIMRHFVLNLLMGFNFFLKKIGN